ncbi:MAG TPA: hypothetical protein VMC09_08745 [Anaerolineales bacterium]|nr:hypothetical protein [Anaerolineales bacterium]
MKSLYHAYQAYERRTEKGEFSRRPSSYPSLSILPDSLLVQLGEFLIQTGLKLKRRHTAGKSMAWSPMTGSKQ